MFDSDLLKAYEAVVADAAAVSRILTTAATDCIMRALNIASLSVTICIPVHGAKSAAPLPAAAPPPAQSPTFVNLFVPTCASSIGDDLFALPPPSSAHGHGSSNTSNSRANGSNPRRAPLPWRVAVRRSARADEFLTSERLWPHVDTGIGVGGGAAQRARRERCDAFTILSSAGGAWVADGYGYASRRVSAARSAAGAGGGGVWGRAGDPLAGGHHCGPGAHSVTPSPTAPGADSRTGDAVDTPTAPTARLGLFGRLRAELRGARGAAGGAGLATVPASAAAGARPGSAGHTTAPSPPLRGASVPAMRPANRSPRDQTAFRTFGSSGTLVSRASGGLADTPSSRSGTRQELGPLGYDSGSNGDDDDDDDDHGGATHPNTHGFELVSCTPPSQAARQVAVSCDGTELVSAAGFSPSVTRTVAAAVSSPLSGAPLHIEPRTGAAARRQCAPPTAAPATGAAVQPAARGSSSGGVKPKVPRGPAQWASNGAAAVAKRASRLVGGGGGWRALRDASASAAGMDNGSGAASALRETVRAAAGVWARRLTTAAVAAPLTHASRVLFGQLDASVAAAAAAHSAAHAAARGGSSAPPTAGPGGPACVPHMINKGVRARSPRGAVTGPSPAGGGGAGGDAGDACGGGRAHRRRPPPRPGAPRGSADGERGTGALSVPGTSWSSVSPLSSPGTSQPTTAAAAVVSGSATRLGAAVVDDGVLRSADALDVLIDLVERCIVASRDVASATAVASPTAAPPPPGPSGKECVSPAAQPSEPSVAATTTTTRTPMTRVLRALPLPHTPFLSHAVRASAAAIAHTFARRERRVVDRSASPTRSTQRGAAALAAMNGPDAGSDPTHDEEPDSRHDGQGLHTSKGNMAGDDHRGGGKGVVLNEDTSGDELVEVGDAHCRGHAHASAIAALLPTRAARGGVRGRRGSVAVTDDGVRVEDAARPKRRKATAAKVAKGAAGGGSGPKVASEFGNGLDALGGDGPIASADVDVHCVGGRHRDGDGRDGGDGARGAADPVVPSVGPGEGAVDATGPRTEDDISATAPARVRRRRTRASTAGTAGESAPGSAEPATAEVDQRPATAGATAGTTAEAAAGAAAEAAAVGPAAAATTGPAREEAKARLAKTKGERRRTAKATVAAAGAPAVVAAQVGKVVDGSVVDAAGAADGDVVGDAVAGGGEHDGGLAASPPPEQADADTRGAVAAERLGAPVAGAPTDQVVVPPGYCPPTADASRAPHPPSHTNPPSHATAQPMFTSRPRTATTPTRRSPPRSLSVSASVLVTASDRSATALTLATDASNVVDTSMDPAVLYSLSPLYPLAAMAEVSGGILGALASTSPLGVPPPPPRLAPRAHPRHEWRGLFGEADDGACAAAPPSGSSAGDMAPPADAEGPTALTVHRNEGGDAVGGGGVRPRRTSRGARGVDDHRTHGDGVVASGGDGGGGDRGPEAAGEGGAARSDAGEAAGAEGGAGVRSQRGGPKAAERKARRRREGGGRNSAGGSTNAGGRVRDGDGDDVVSRQTRGSGAGDGSSSDHEGGGRRGNPATQTREGLDVRALQVTAVDACIVALAEVAGQGGADELIPRLELAVQHSLRFSARAVSTAQALLSVIDSEDAGTAREFAIVTLLAAVHAVAAGAM